METYRSGSDASSKQSCELFVAKAGQDGFQRSARKHRSRT